MSINILKKVAILLLMLKGVNSFALTPDFVVYFISGKAFKTTGNKAMPLKEKDKLFFSDKLNILPNAQVMLICKNGNIIKLKDSGKQNLVSITPECSRPADSFTSAYFHFIFDEFSADGTVINEQNYFNNLGAISRGWPVMNIFADTINYYTGSLNITMRSNGPTGTVNVFADAKGSQPLKKISYFHNSLILDTLIRGLKSPGTYFWAISDGKDRSSPLYLLQLMDDADYKERVASVLKYVVRTTPAETAYMSAFLLEKNHFLTEAAQYYNQAYMLEPKNLVYKNAKLRFYE